MRQSSQQRCQCCRTVDHYTARRDAAQPTELACCCRNPVRSPPAAEPTRCTTRCPCGWWNVRVRAQTPKPQPCGGGSRAEWSLCIPRTSSPPHRCGGSSQRREEGKPTRTSPSASSRSNVTSSLPHIPSDSLFHWMWFLDVFSISPIPAPRDRRCPCTVSSWSVRSFRRVRLCIRRLPRLPIRVLDPPCTPRRKSNAGCEGRAASHTRHASPVRPMSPLAIPSVHVCAAAVRVWPSPSSAFGVGDDRRTDGGRRWLKTSATCDRYDRRRIGAANTPPPAPPTAPPDNLRWEMDMWEKSSGTPRTL